MNRKRLLLYLIFIAYQGGAFLFTYLVDGHMDLLGLLKFVPWFKYIAFLGLLLIILDVAWSFMEHKSNVQQKKQLKDENTDLKAKLYDKQELERKSSNGI